MMSFIIAIHVIACILLICIILVQAGRGGGLVENFSGVESMFGTKTNAFLTRTTTVLSVLFFFTCLSLAFFSAKQSRSLMQGVKTEAEGSPAQPSLKPVPVAEKTDSQPVAVQAQSTQENVTKEAAPQQAVQAVEQAATGTVSPEASKSE
jgi:preprotein translocase subunit SecG